MWRYSKTIKEERKDIRYAKEEGMKSEDNTVQRKDKGGRESDIRETLRMHRSNCKTNEEK